jgi:hypothetical protein
VALLLLLLLLLLKIRFDFLPPTVTHFTFSMSVPSFCSTRHAL